MGVGHSSTLHRNLQAIFESGTCTGLTDAHLVDRFVNEPGRSAHLAFEALVTRHGPMVLRVCRGILRDEHDAQDACQAVFLILARRAWAIRSRDSLAGWLYRIAVRVSKRQRCRKNREAILQGRGERRGWLLSGAHQASKEHQGESFDDFTEILQEELDRLEPKLREPVVLCYFEGLTHDEAAERLGWPVGTVRSRMARARDRLRHRLSRRGITGSGAGALGAWINLGPGHQVEAASSRLIQFVSIPSLPSNFVNATVEAAARFVAHRPPIAGAGAASFAVLSLAKGVLQAMLLEKMTAVALVVVPVGVLALGAETMYGQVTGSKNGPASAPTKPDASSTGKAESGDKAAEPGRPDTDEDSKRWKAILEAAKKRYEIQKVEYEEGRITTDRFLAACAALAQAEKALAGDPVELEEAQLRYLARVEAIVSREKAELQVGKGTPADVAEAEQHLQQVKLELTQIRGDEPAFHAEAEQRVQQLQGELDEIRNHDPAYRELVQKASERYKTQKAFYDEGRLTVDRLLDASTQLGEAEKAASKLSHEEIEAQRRSVQRVEKILEEAKAKLGEGKIAAGDVSEINLRRLQLELELRRLEKRASAPTRRNQASPIVLPPPVAPRANLATLPQADPFEPSPIDPPRRPQEQPAQVPIDPSGRPQEQPGNVRLANSKLFAEYLTTAKRIFETQENMLKQGQTSIDAYVSACEVLARAEQKVARSPAEREASLKQLVKRLKEIEEHIRAQVKAGLMTQLELDQVVRQRLEAEIDLENGGSPSTDQAELSALKKRVRDLETTLIELIKALPTPIPK